MLARINESCLDADGRTGESMRKLCSDGLGLRRKVCSTGERVASTVASVDSERRRNVAGKVGESIAMVMLGWFPGIFGKSSALNT